MKKAKKSVDFIKLRGSLGFRIEKRGSKKYKYPIIRLKDKDLVKQLPKDFTLFAIRRLKPKNKDKLLK